MRAKLTLAVVCVAGALCASRARADDPEPLPSAGRSVLSIVQPTLLGEVDYRIYPSEIEGNTGFALARLRTGVSLTPVDWFRAVATVEFADEHPLVLDAFARFTPAPWVELTVGYSKPPLFASFTYEPVHTMSMPGRAPVVTAFGVRRDLGADVHFAPRTAPIEAWVRVGNGTGSPLGNDNALPAAYGALDLVLGRAWAGAAREASTFGLRLGGAAMVESPRDRDGIIGQTPFGFVYYRPNVVNGLRVVGEAHAVFYGGPVRVPLEGAMARESRSRDDDGNQSTPRVALPELRSYGITAELAWVLRGAWREVGNAPRGNLRTDAWDGGALELAARYDALWIGHGAMDVRSGGAQSGALALKWWPTDFLAASLAGYGMRYDVPPLEAPGERWSWGALVRASFFWGLPGRARAHGPGRSV